MKQPLLLTAGVFGLLLAASPLAAQTASSRSAGESVAVPGEGIAGVLLDQDKAQEEKHSPWLLLPLVASSPKMGIKMREPITTTEPVAIELAVAQPTLPDPSR